MSDSFVPYPHRNPQPVRGVLAGSQPPSSPGELGQYRIGQGPIALPRPTSSDPNDRSSAVPVRYPTGSPVELHWVQVITAFDNMVAVSQGGQLLGLVPPWYKMNLQLRNAGTDLILTPIATPGETLDSSDVYLVWSTEPIGGEGSYPPGITNVTVVNFPTSIDVGTVTNILNPVRVQPFAIDIPNASGAVDATRTTDGTTNLITAGSSLVYSLQSVGVEQAGPGSCLIKITYPGGPTVRLVGVPAVGYAGATFPFGVQVPPLATVDLVNGGSGAGTEAIGMVAFSVV